MPSRDHVGYMPQDPTGQIQIPAPPNTPVHTRYPTQQQHPANFTPTQAQQVQQQLASIGVQLPPQSQIFQAPNQTNTS